jgi:hypothetical protein
MPCRRGWIREIVVVPDPVVHLRMARALVVSNRLPGNSSLSYFDTLRTMFDLSVGGDSIVFSLLLFSSFLYRFSLLCLDSLFIFIAF